MNTNNTYKEQKREKRRPLGKERQNEKKVKVKQKETQELESQYLS